MKEELKEREEWNNLRPILTQTYTYNSSWEKAILLFEKRLKNKFFSPIESLIQARILKGEGFSIVTVQCAIIESLASFREGKIFNHNKHGNLPRYEYRKSWEIFVNFLHSASIFEDNFWEDDGAGGKVLNSPFNANDFYTDVRCGLMHEARTKQGWTITATKKAVKTERIFLQRNGNEIKILRTVLHYRLIEYLKNYLAELREQTIEGEDLRRKFARKLDHLFGIMPDPTNYDWWIDN